MYSIRTIGTLAFLIAAVSGCGSSSGSDGGADQSSQTALSAETLRSSETRIIAVNSLDDAGPGTLRECVESNIRRVCVFEVSGRILLSSPLVIERDELFIAGQTAPSPGILVTNAGILIHANDVRIEHIAIRPGDDEGGPAPSDRDGVTIQGAGARNITLRNLSISWALDENFSTNGTVQDVLVEHCIISEALHSTLHPKGPHSMGALIGEGGHGVTFVGNLFAANNDRNARWKANTSGEMIGNLIYGWGGDTPWNTTNLSDLEDIGGAVSLDVISNVYRPGPDGLASAYAVYAENPPEGTQVYLSDNVSPRTTNLAESFLASAPVIGRAPPPYGSAETTSRVFGSSGSRPWERNGIDQSVLDGAAAQTLRIRKSVGRWPSIAENHRTFDLAGTTIETGQVEARIARFR